MKPSRFAAAIGSLAAASIVAPGCAREVRQDRPGAPATPALSAVREAAAKIVLCQTTEDELRRQLGAPYRDGRIAQGRVLSWLPSGDSDSKHYLAVLLRPAGDGSVVVDEYFDVPTEIVWTPTDRCPH